MTFKYLWIIYKLNTIKELKVDGYEYIGEDIDFYVDKTVPDKEKEVAFYRVKYPDASLLELSQIISMETGNKITKSGVYHRLNKIKDLAFKLKKKSEN